ncbi:putative transferase, protein kinase RLK-Pelle-RLCK-VIIa-2 family [Helianthus annuus]|nr:putative transferase, protein kinase RLK-Pelle-RLCK-VIIa-2 family [Helianthus annuus]
MGICVGKQSNVAHASSTQFLEDMINNKAKSNSKSLKSQTKTVSLNKVSKAHKNNDHLPVPINLKAFNLNDLKAATKNFRPDSLLGEGGFGQVFKGWVDEATLAPAKPGTGMVVAVKILKEDSRQGHREWLVSDPLSFDVVCCLLLCFHNRTGHFTNRLLGHIGHICFKKQILNTRWKFFFF